MQYLALTEKRRRAGEVGERERRLDVGALKQLRVVADLRARTGTEMSIGSERQEETEGGLTFLNCMTRFMSDLTLSWSSVLDARSISSAIEIRDRRLWYSDFCRGLRFT